MPLDAPEDIILLAEAMGCGPEMVGMNDREAEAFAREKIDGAIYVGDTVPQSCIDNVS